MKLFLIGFFIALSATSQAQKFNCPPKDGSYEDSIQCDKFYECEDGVAREKLCPDGLVFNQNIRKINKCDQPFNVECGERQELQPPQSNKNCPRRNGFFAHPEPNVCDIFFNCIEGDHTEVKCTAGLHFDEYTGTCVWPATANRQGCDKSTTTKLKDGFECPKEGQTDSNGQLVVHPRFPHPTDCQRFYVCLNGQEPRDLGCQTGEVYNDETQRCDNPENVTGCENWYSEEASPSAGTSRKA